MWKESESNESPDVVLLVHYNFINTKMKTRSNVILNVTVLPFVHNMIIIYIDIILLVILLCLTIFACGYCFYRVRSLQRSGQVAILLRPTRVLFKHKNEEGANEELRTVVAYQNPFTGDYCVHKSRIGPKGYLNSIQPKQDLDSPDSGVSDEYEPLNLDPLLPGIEDHEISRPPSGRHMTLETKNSIKPQPGPEDINSVNKTWNWNYTEYQI